MLIFHLFFFLIRILDLAPNSKSRDPNCLSKLRALKEVILPAVLEPSNIRRYEVSSDILDFECIERTQYLEQLRQDMFDLAKLQIDKSIATLKDDNQSPHRLEVARHMMLCLKHLKKFHNREELLTSIKRNLVGSTKSEFNKLKLFFLPANFPEIQYIVLIIKA
ncbi:unnamed protein product [Protopolystoma xenopodis]|uniref:NR LBD domain-containing protein n=1 Tax=Protopolystoma xenopodis TaxID=117903 RepID=A0A3S5FE83_9PLAT|nr:unnamed protein product [Protopolystoma xenopodis]